jgi:hypothetical protein
MAVSLGSGVVVTCRDRSRAALAAHEAEVPLAALVRTRSVDPWDRGPAADA